MSIDKTTLNRIRIAIQHAFCSTIHDDVNHKSMAEACVDLGIIEKVEDFDTETFDHAPILFEKLWEKIGDSHYKSPLELFEAWGKDEVAIYRLGDELEDFPESALEWEAIFNALSDDEPTSNFLFVGEDFAKLYIDRTVAELNDMQCEAFELMREYTEQKERHKKAMFIGAKIFGRQDGKTHKTKEGRKSIRMYDPETNEAIGTVCVPMTHEEAHGKKEPVDDIKVTEPSVFDPVEGTLEIKVAKEDADIIAKIFGNISDEEVKRLSDASKNAAEIFCRATDGSYKDFNQYAAEFGAFTPKESLNLPYVVDESIRKVSRISELAEIEINTPLLVYSVYKSRYEPTKYPYGASDVIFDIVDSMLELKKEGMIQ